LTVWSAPINVYWAADLVVVVVAAAVAEAKAAGGVPTAVVDHRRKTGVYIFPIKFGNYCFYLDYGR